MIDVRAVGLCFAWFRWFVVGLDFCVLWWLAVGGFGGTIPLLACLFLGLAWMLFAILYSLVC